MSLRQPRVISGIIAWQATISLTDSCWCSLTDNRVGFYGRYQFQVSGNGTACFVVVPGWDRCFGFGAGCKNNVGDASGAIAAAAFWRMADE
jgi:hypothetical protein